jgi:hypothetical protein
MTTYPVTVDVVTRLASVLDEAPTDLPPLSHSTDPDALERLVESIEHGSVTFSHAGCGVTVLISDGEYTVEVDAPAGGD